MSWDGSWEDAPLYELLNMVKNEVAVAQTEAQGFLNSVCEKSKRNGDNKITVVLKKKDLDPFYKMRQIPFEMGGILDVSEDGLLRSGIVGGGKKTVRSSQLPNYAVHFHTHPSFPAVPDNTGIIEYTISVYKKKPSKFPIDIMLQSISNSDLSTFSSIVLQNRSQAMVIFSPEGVYILTPDPDKIRVFNKGKDSNFLKKEGMRILNERNSIITDEIVHIKKYLEEALGTDNDKKIIKRLQEFQRGIANKIVKMIRHEHSILHARYYTWNAKEISIEIYCNRILDEPSSFLGLSPHSS